MRTWWTQFTGGMVQLFLAVLVLTQIAVATSGLAQDAMAIELSRLEARAKAGERTSELGNAHHNLAIQLRNAGQNGRAEQPARRALAIWEKVHGQSSGAVANACNTLAAILDQLRKDAEAEQCARRAVNIWEKEHGLDSGEAANALNTLVGIMRTRGRWDDAEQPARRVLRAWTKVNGPDSDAAANASNTLSDVLQHKRNFDEAEKLARNALRIWQKLHGADSEAADNARNTLAGALDGLGRKDEALREQQRVLDSWSKRFGPRSGFVGLGANNLAWKQLGAGHVDAAEKLFRRTLDIWSEVDTRPSKPSTGIPLSGLARTAMLKRDWRGAHDWVEQAVKIAIERTRMASTEADKTRASKAPSEIAQAGGNLQLLIKAAHQMGAADPSRTAALSDETYRYAQWRLGSQVADALAAMASRVAVDPTLATAIRQRQDFEVRWQAIDRSLEANRNKPADQRDKRAEQALLDEAKSVETKLVELDKRLSRDFAKYAAIARIEPLTVEQTQALLGSDEALVLFLPTGAEPPITEETFIWVVTKTETRWVRSQLGTEALTREVAALRCGLDATLWDDATDWPQTTDELVRERAAQIARRQRCEELLKAKPKMELFGLLPVQMLPFDHARAHKLYKGLFGEVEDLIKDKHLLIVPSGPLTQLPFQVLITAPPGSEQNDKTAAWFIRSHALTVLPAVSSLEALRRVAKPSAATKPMIGFGNPLLDGDQKHPLLGKQYKQLASLAATLKGCAATATQRTAGLRGFHRGILPMPQIGNHVDVGQVRIQVPLPETAEELCDVARGLGTDVNDIRLGARATEREVKALSTSGQLAQYRVVHFATHGTLAGQLSGTTEPGLILTPPAQASEDDDGYLSAGEIAALKLDADWVILSACNTAGGERNGDGAEALSGLARAFFYAQARALLVSHWEVNSRSTVKLVSAAVGATARDGTIGRAEALRRAMIAMIDTGKSYEAHPTYWAPFVVVGEGAAAR